MNTKHYSVFVAREISLPKFSEFIDRILAVSSVVENPQPEWRCVWRLLEIEVIAYNHHGLVNNSGIDFENYAIQIGLVGEFGDLLAERNALHYTLAFFLATKIALKFECKTIVTENLQKLVGSFDSTKSGNQ